MATAAEKANQVIMKAKEDWYKAQAAGDEAGMEAAHAAAEAARSQGGTIGANVVTEVDIRAHKDSTSEWAKKEYSADRLGKVLTSGAGHTDYPELDRESGGGIVNLPEVPAYTRGTMPVLPSIAGQEDYFADIQQLSQMQFEQAQAALQGAREQTLASIEGEEAKLEGMYRAQRTSLKVAAAKGAKSLGEYLSVRGLSSSGTAAQAAMGLRVAEQESLTESMGAEAGQRAEYGLARIQTESAYETSLAQAQMQAQTQAFQAMVEEKQRVAQMLDEWTMNVANKFIDAEIRKAESAQDFEYQKELNEQKASLNERLQVIKTELESGLMEQEAALDRATAGYKASLAGAYEKTTSPGDTTPSGITFPDSVFKSGVDRIIDSIPTKDEAGFDLPTGAIMSNQAAAIADYLVQQEQQITINQVRQLQAIYGISDSDIIQAENRQRLLQNPEQQINQDLWRW